MSGDYPKEKREWRWRGDLLSSSLPLEYRVARILVEEGFGVTPDLGYTRVLDGKSVEFSVDISAYRGTKTNRTVFGMGTRLLLECKYRRPSKVWFFVPDPESITIADYFPERILRCVDTFSDTTVDQQPLFDFTKRVRSCYKGVEVDLESGSGNRVSDEELRHGLEQLQYGLGSVVQSAVGRALWEMANFGKSEPFVFAPILVTSAPLFVAKPDLSDDEISSSEAIGDFSYRVPWLSLKVNIGKALIEHVATLLAKAHANEVITAGLLRLELEGERDEASEYWRSLLSGDNNEVENWFSQVLVCSVERLPELLRQITSTSNAIIGGVEDSAVIE